MSTRRVVARDRAHLRSARVPRDRAPHRRRGGGCGRRREPAAFGTALERREQHDPALRGEPLPRRLGRVQLPRASSRTGARRTPGAVRPHRARPRVLPLSAVGVEGRRTRAPIAPRARRRLARDPGRRGDRSGRRERIGQDDAREGPLRAVPPRLRPHALGRRRRGERTTRAGSTSASPCSSRTSRASCSRSARTSASAASRRLADLEAIDRSARARRRRFLRRTRGPTATTRSSARTSWAARTSRSASGSASRSPARSSETLRSSSSTSRPRRSTRAPSTTCSHGCATSSAAASVLLISHRFSSVRSADRIYVLHEGRVVESGTHDELMHLGGRYAELFTMQASAYLAPTRERVAP